MKMLELITTLILTILLGLVNTQEQLPPSCYNEIYCYGELLHTVQMNFLFPDSKTFVDMKMKQNITITLNLFKELMTSTGQKPTKNDINQFVSKNFEPAGSEFEKWKPSDWHENPQFLKNISDMILRNWAEDLHKLWKLLGRKVKSEVLKNPELYSIIPVENPVIIPGGRFREFYYWDSYWIIRGLLLSEMSDTVRGMLNNFMSIVDRYGHIPNGGRIYYLMRSQPPFLIPMVDEYVEATKDYNFLKNNIKYLIKEFQFWQNNRSVSLTKDGKQYKLFAYKDSSAGPRPESYREDFSATKHLQTENEKNRLYSEIKTAAESGWDFSSRWFISNGTNQGNLTNLNIKSLIPVDLNSYMHLNAKLLSKFLKQLNRLEDAKYYNDIANDLLEAINVWLWYPERGAWLDYDRINNKKRDYFSASNLIPLWTKSYPKQQENYYITQVLKYIEKSKVLLNLGGIPSTLVHTGEQWDFPNAWPPLQHMIITGLANTDNMEAQNLAFQLAERWVRSNYKAYTDNHHMYEKYDATIVGGHGGGGEYEVQLGFGWSNAIIMDLLNQYGNRVLLNEPFKSSTLKIDVKGDSTNSAITSTNFGPYITLLLAISATFSCIGAVVYSILFIPRLDHSKYHKINKPYSF